MTTATDATVTLPRKQFEMLAIWACFCEELHVQCASCQITKPALEALSSSAPVERPIAPELAEIAKALKAYPDSDLVSLATACRTASERYERLYDLALPAIEQAIANEDGLDGSDGERILREFGYWPKRLNAPAETQEEPSFRALAIIIAEEAFAAGAPWTRGAKWEGAAAIVDRVLAELPSSPETQEERPDERTLALLIVKRCAAFVRGYMVPPPESAAYAHKTEWLRFQDCARFLEAQPNAIINSAAQSSPVPHEAMTSTDEGWSCVECGTFVAGTAIHLATAICKCGVGRGRWGACMRPLTRQTSEPPAEGDA